MSALPVSVIIVNTNEGGVLFDCLDWLERCGRPDETIVVDNSSTDGSPERVIAEYPWVTVLPSGGNRGYAGANMMGAERASGNILVFLNPDAFVQPGWTDAVRARFACDERIGVVGPKIYRGRPGAEARFDSAGCDLEFPLGEGSPRGYLVVDEGQFDEPADVAYASGAAFAIRADVLDEVGGLDVSFWCYAEESDLCWRARMRGYRCVYEPAALVYHIGSYTFGNASARKLYFQTRNRICMCLQNLETVNAFWFAANETLHGLAVIAAGLLFSKYRSLGLAYARAWKDALLRLPLTLRTRTRRQRERRMPDAQVLAVHKRLSLLKTLLRYTSFVKSGRAYLHADYRPPTATQPGAR
jgi:GT2 family glycosyltransferase